MQFAILHINHIYLERDTNLCLQKNTYISSTRYNLRTHIFLYVIHSTYVNLHSACISVAFCIYNIRSSLKLYIFDAILDLVKMKLFLSHL